MINDNTNFSTTNSNEIEEKGSMFHLKEGTIFQGTV